MSTERLAAATPHATSDAPLTVRLNGAQALVRLFEAEGVPFAFGIVGGKLAPLLRALSDSTIRFVGARHEQAGPMMAAAINASTGAVAVALGEMGPGGLSLAAGAGVAFNNNLAVLLVTTNQHRAAAYPHSDMGGFNRSSQHWVVKQLSGTRSGLRRVSSSRAFSVVWC